MANEPNRRRTTRSDAVADTGGYSSSQSGAGGREIQPGQEQPQRAEQMNRQRQDAQKRQEEQQNIAKVQMMPIQTAEMAAATERKANKLAARDESSSERVTGAEVAPGAVARGAGLDDPDPRRRLTRPMHDLTAGPDIEAGVTVARPFGSQPHNVDIKTGRPITNADRRKEAGEDEDEGEQSEGKIGQQAA